MKQHNVTFYPPNGNLVLYSKFEGNNRRVIPEQHMRFVPQGVLMMIKLSTPLQKLRNNKSLLSTRRSRLSRHHNIQRAD